MRAIVQDEYGEAGTSCDSRRSTGPQIGDDEVLVRVHAAGVDRGDWHLMAGLPYLIRLAGFGLRAPKNPVRGRMSPGASRRSATDVTTLQPGDEVFGIGDGSFAEYARARADKLAPKPANLTLRAGRGRPGLRPHRAAGRARPRTRAAGTEGADHRRVGRRRDLRRADRQGVRRRGHRRVQHGEGGPGPLARRRPRHRLHARGLRRRGSALRRDPRHRRQPLAVAAPARPHPQGDARDHRRRDGRPVARRHRPPAPGARCCPRSWARSWARSSRRRTTRTWSSSPSSSSPAASRRPSTAPTRWARSPRRSGTCRRARPRQGRHHRARRRPGLIARDELRPPARSVREAMDQARGVGLEPTTLRLTAECSAIELPPTDALCCATPDDRQARRGAAVRPQPSRGSLRTVARTSAPPAAPWQATG